MTQVNMIGETIIKTRTHNLSGQTIQTMLSAIGLSYIVEMKANDRITTAVESYNNRADAEIAYETINDTLSALTSVIGA